MEKEGYFENSLKKVDVFRKALSRETDRGCGLFAAAFLDESLKELLKSIFIKNNKSEAELFSANGPLATFSARIRILYYMGKLSQSERRDLELIKKIRNDFAHNAELVEFESPGISSQCKELFFSYHEKSHRARGHFTAACMGLLKNIHLETFNSKKFEEKSDNAPSEEVKAINREKIKKLMIQIIGENDGDDYKI